jgi:hypothetical protein
MAIDRSGEWARGDQAADLDEFLTEFSAVGYPVSRVEHARCGQCGHSVFAVLLDDEQGAVQRICAACAADVLMLDSADTIADADLGQAVCPCGGERFEIAVGFALKPDDAVEWLYVALRCTADGTLGVYVDWGIDYAPSSQLLTQV